MERVVTRLTVLTLESYVELIAVLEGSSIKKNTQLTCQ